jgi:acylphosphatase
LTDGRVEVVAEGSEKAVGELLGRVKKGPTGAKVSEVVEGKVDGKEKLEEGFEIRDTGEPPKAG